MAKRPGLSEAKVVDAAIDMINKEGLVNLSVANLAKHFKVKPPSLYNHMDSLDALQRAMALRGIKELTAVGQKATMGRAGFDALKCLALAYRDFAKRQPGLYALTQRSYEGSDDELAAAAGEAVEIFLSALRAYELSDEDALHAVRCIRSSLHGFVALETNGGFGLPLQVDESFEKLIAMLDKGLKDI